MPGKVLSLDAALEAVREEARALPEEPVALTEVAGRVIAEDVVADADIPPFARVTMDGYAVRSGDVAAPGATLAAIGTLHAGRVFDGVVGPGQAVRVMTGAPLPAGADCVQPVERITLQGEQVVILDAVPAGRNVALRGEDQRAGQVVLTRGTPAGPAEIALLATVGKARVSAHRRPTACVIATGDEIVDVAATPHPGQIRNSNGPMLATLAAALGCGTVTLPPPAPDAPDLLRAALVEGLRHDVLFISGGVSAGDKDLVGATLESLGVRRVFHGVSLQPGRPLWFGRSDRCLVFGLPGNPVSSLVTATLFGGLAVAALRGVPDPRPGWRSGVLTAPADRNPSRTGLLPARVAWSSEQYEVEPLAWNGSGDMVTTARANAFWLAPEGTPRFERGTRVRFLPRPA